MFPSFVPGIAGRVPKAWHVRVAVACVVATMGCGGGSPTTPSPPSTGGGGGTTTACRTFATSQTLSSVVAGVTTPSTFTASFNQATNQFTVTQSAAAIGACQTFVSSYPSRAAFVDEVRVVPGLVQSSGFVGTASGACGSGSVTSSHIYDQLGRLVLIRLSGSDGAVSTTTYTQWDTAGRPLVGTIAPTSASVAFTYNESTRTTRETTTSQAGTTVAETTHDANGIAMRVVVTAQGVTTTNTFTTGGTDRVCK